MLTLQEMIRRLTQFWAEQGCTIHHGHDVEVGAGTFNPATFFRCLGPEPYRAAYVEPSRRPKDGRYGENPNRMQFFHQFQVILKPSPLDIQERYLRSLEVLGYDLSRHDIRFVHDDWEQPSLGAWGLGWEVWRDGMEVTQYTYFQAVGGIECRPVTVELAYGIERLAMDLLGVDNVWDLMWNESLSYRDIFQQSEYEWSHYNFEAANTEMWAHQFEGYRKEAEALLARSLPFPAYDFLMKACHAFNILDARGVISVTERTGYITSLRELSRQAAECYLASREKRGFPLLDRQWPGWTPTVNATAPAVKSGPLNPSERTTFLLEIGSEELPATFVPIGCANLHRDLADLFKKLEIPFESIEANGTPRRLTAYVRGIASAIPGKSEKRRGPPLSAAFDTQGHATEVGKGFFRSIGKEATSLDALRRGAEGIEIAEVKGQEYLFAQIETAPASTAERLAAHLPALILGLDFPKKMHWSDLEIAYARPLHWFVALLGEEVVPFAISNILSGRTSRGHRQLDPAPFEIASAADYFESCRSHKVMVSIAERRAVIEKQLSEIEAKLGARAVAVDRVMGQVLHLVEWPTLTAPPFDERFLRAPKEVLISEMVEHQKYFPLERLDGRLLNHYVIVADRNITDEVVKGNTKVLSARLSDGLFLYEQDLKLDLEVLNERLKEVTYRKELGSVYDKSLRLVGYIDEIAGGLELDREAHLAAKRAALLCKADLASGLVGEFPELQGVVGREYAMAKEGAAVATAIEEHWMPRGEGAPLPATSAGIVLALAEKIDNLLSCFSLGLLPTSSSDPYALRRQLLGMVRILIENRIHLSERDLFARCYRRFLEATGLPESREVLGQLEEFHWNRIRTIFQQYGLSHDEIEAAIRYNQRGSYDSFLRAQAIHHFRRGAYINPLAEVYKRIVGLLEGVESVEVDPAQLKEPSEQRLAKRLAEMGPQVAANCERQEYEHAFSSLAELQPLLKEFFDEVKVVDDDLRLRANRLALLAQVRRLFDQLLDFSKLQLSR